MWLSSLTAVKKTIAQRWKPPNGTSFVHWLWLYMDITYLQLSSARINNVASATIASWTDLRDLRDYFLSRTVIKRIARMEGGCVPGLKLKCKISRCVKLSILFEHFIYGLFNINFSSSLSGYSIGPSPRLLRWQVLQVHEQHGFQEELLWVHVTLRHCLT